MSDQVSDFGPEIMDPETGELRPARDIVVEEIAKGSAGAFKRAKRADPLSAVSDCTDAHRKAAAVYRQAYEHVQAGKGMGPMPWGRDAVGGRSGGPRLHAQERALSAAEYHRRGVQAMGAAAAGGVVWWVVIEGQSLASYDARMKWRRHTGRGQLLAALDALAREYGLE